MKSPLRLLLVEDSEDASLLISEELRRHGYALEMARVENAQALREALAGENWDVIIADYLLPGFGAIAALRLVRESGLDLPFIVVSGSVSEELVVSVMKAGAHDYIMKGNLTRLVPAIERELREARVREARREAEAALKESKARLLLAQKIGHVGSWDLDLRRETLNWSPETFRIFGYEPDSFEPTLERFFEAAHPDDREMIRKASERALREGGSYSVDHRIIRPDGSQRVVHEQAEILFDDRGVAIQKVGTVQDITERKLLEEQLRHSQKMEAVGQLAGGIAHDFNNILTVIRGYAELIAANASLPPETRGQLNQISISTERASKLTGQLLAFSRKQPMQLKTLNLNELLKGLAAMLQRVLGEQVSLDLRLGDNHFPIRADAGMVEQLLVNLALNSRDAMPKGGTLVIETALELIDSAYRRSHPEAIQGQFIRLRISDTGRGMDRETLTRAFEPFFTTKEIGKGTGLGLSMVYGIVKQHQGWVQAASEVGSGTVFDIFLPVSAGHAAKEIPNRVAPAVPGGKETILLVEDEPALRNLVRNLLQHYGYRLIEAGSGPEAVQLWEKHQEEVQLLLTDMVMPGGMTGGELARELKQRKPDLKVLYTSGYSLDLVQGGKLLREGINFIPKPYNVATLCRMVRACLDSAD